MDFLDVISDSGEAVEYALEKKLLPNNIRIRTASPYFARSKNSNVEKLEQHIPQQKTKELINSSREICAQIYQKLKKSNFADWALTAALSATVLLRLVYKTMSLDERDFKRPIALLKIATNSNLYNQIYNVPWDQILINNKSLKVIDIPLIELSSFKEKKEIKKTFWQEVKLIDPKFYFLKFLQKFSNPKKETILLLDCNNEILKEIAILLGLKGFNLKSVTAEKISTEKLDKDVEKQIGELLKPTIESYLSNWVAPSAVTPLFNVFFLQIIEFIQIYNNSLAMWQKQPFKNAKMILTNFPIKPTLLPLGKICREKGILLVTAQHGNAREIHGFHHKGALCIYENNLVDLFFTYNQEASKISQKENPFSVGQCVSVGIPTHYWKKSKKKFSLTKKKPIIYVSNFLYMGNRQALYVGVPDHDRATFEINMIEKVFEKIPYKVFFKFNAADGIPRYLDPDPVKKCIESTANTLLYDGNIDLDYIIQKYRVVVLSGCSNTLGKSLLTNIPLVFVNIPWISPLREELKSEFAQAVFLYDISTPGTYEDLKSFLSKPLKEIEAMWKEKSPARKQFIEKYIACQGPAAKRGAQILEELLTGKKQLCDL